MNRLTDTSRNSRNSNSGKLYGCHDIEQAITRLADYEDAGHTPNEVYRLETIISELEARLIKEQNARKAAEAESMDDEKDADGLWDLAAEITVAVGLEKRSNKSEVVYAEDWGQEIIYNILSSRSGTAEG